MIGVIFLEGDLEAMDVRFYLRVFGFVTLRAQSEDPTYDKEGDNGYHDQEFDEGEGFFSSHGREGQGIGHD